VAGGLVDESRQSHVDPGAGELAAIAPVARIVSVERADVEDRWEMIHEAMPRSIQINQPGFFRTA